MDKQHIIDEIRRTAEINGGIALGKSRFAEETGIKEWDWSGVFWAKWSDAVVEAGFTPNEMQRATNKEKLVKEFITIIRRYGRWPTSTELRLTTRGNADFASHTTYNRLGKTKAKRVTTILSYCQQQVGYDDVIEICEALVESGDSPSSDTSIENSAKYGFVYLMKTGKFFKIGHSDAPGRREYDLAANRPEGIEIVHTIKTDDPAGIEAYWQNRFKDKAVRVPQRSKELEYFKLTAEDVRAFKRRRGFM